MNKMMMDRIAQNRGPIFPPAGALVVHVVPVGHVVQSVDQMRSLVVTNESIVVREQEAFVTQDTWDFVKSCSQVREV